MKYIFLPALFFCVTNLSAQLKKGDWTIGTSTNAPLNLNLKSNKPGFSSYEFTFNPIFGYFLKNRWEVGGGPILSFKGAEFKDEFGTIGLKNNSQSYGFNFYTRYYLKNEGKFVPYFTANANFVKTTGMSTDITGLKSTFRLNEWQTGAGVGASWFITPKAALFSELTYTSNWGGGSGYTNGLKLNVGFQIFLGGKEKK